MKFGKVLSTILTAAAKEDGKLRFYAEDCIICIATLADLGLRRERGKALVARTYDDASRQILEKKLPELRMQQTALKDIFRFLTDVIGAKFEIDWPALRAVDVTEKTTLTIAGQDITGQRAG